MSNLTQAQIFAPKLTPNLILTQTVSLLLTLKKQMKNALMNIYYFCFSLFYQNFLEN